MIPAQDIQDKAWEMRRDVVEMLARAGSGHIASSLGLAEFFATMYLGGVMQYNPQDPWWEGRDRLIVSNGHVAPIWYAALAHAGFFPKEELLSYMSLGSKLQGHPQIWMEKNSVDSKTRGGTPGVENTGGSLGQGVSFATGISLALKLKKGELQRKFGYLPRTFCLMSDAELQEGQPWEAFLFAVQRKMSNLTFIIDRNNIEIDANIEDVSPIEPLEAKLEAMGLAVIEINGHEVEEIRDVFEKDLAIHVRPVVIIMHTIPGRGVSFMENDFEWHDRIPDENETKIAIEEIEKYL